MELQSYEGVSHGALLDLNSFEEMLSKKPNVEVIDTAAIKFRMSNKMEEASQKVFKEQNYFWHFFNIKIHPPLYTCIDLLWDQWN